MLLRIKHIDEKKIVGIRHEMSFVNNSTYLLFRSFMPRRNSILRRADKDVLCVQKYPDGFFKNFNPGATFEKWAAVEVYNFSIVPEGMETAIIPEGLYAVFLYIGTTDEADEFFQNIHENWLPSSEYELDNRPHFDVMGEKYKHDSPDSEEEIWIPIRKK